MCQKRDDLDKQILQCRSELSKICPAILVQSIRTKIQEVNSKLFNHLHQIKAHKLEQLTGPSNTRDSSIESVSTVVTIPENLPLSDAEKSVLSKGLNFVPISKKLDEFSVKQDVEKILRRVQLKAFFHDKEDDSNTSDKDIFETLWTRKSKWTPPEGQFASLDFFVNKCRHDINKLNFNRNTKFSNLSSEERVALENLSKRKDIIVKAADKGGALVVWRADLYQKEWVQMNVVPRSTGNTNSGTRELTLKCKFKCYFKPMNNPLGVSPSKGKQGTTRGKEKIF